jgi:mono/diheme cytochrome c family protein
MSPAFRRMVFAAASSLLALSALPAWAAETPLERGTYLMRSIVACGNCHTPLGPDGPLPGMELAGGLPIPGPGFTAYVPNITPDPETGIGGWSDDQIIAAIREGKRPDGTTIGPPMPFEQYRHLSDGDVRAIVAYLRSVAPVRNAVPDSQYPFPLPPAYGPPVASVPEPDRGDTLVYGAYLAGPAGHCIECHTPFGESGFDYANRRGAGGLEIPGPWGVSVSANITPHAEDGIGGWTDQQIKDAITKGVRPDGNQLMPPMAFAYYANMAEADLDAIVVYLRSLKPLPDAAP